MKKEWTNPEMNALEIRNDFYAGNDGGIKGDLTGSPV